MSLYFTERKALAEALRRYVRNVQVGKIASYGTTHKMHLLGLIDRFEDWGLSRLTDASERHMLIELLGEALE